MRQIDLEAVLLDEIPAIIWNHIRGTLRGGVMLTGLDFRLARVKMDGEFTPFTDFESTFHNLQPHPALASSETEADYLRLIADGCLAILLPTEDLDSDCERTLVREILAGLILKKGLELMSEPYMMCETIHNVHQPTLLVLLLQSAMVLTVMAGYSHSDKAQIRRLCSIRTVITDNLVLDSTFQSLCSSSTTITTSSQHHSRS